MASAGGCIAAATGVTKWEVALIPANEDNRVAILPGLGVHNRAHRVLEEGIARRDELLHVSFILRL